MGNDDEKAPTGNDNTAPIVQDDKKARLVIIIIVSNVIVVILTVCISVILMKKRKRKLVDKIQGTLGDDISDVETLQYDFSTIRAATDNFSNANKLGQGGFGPVYKGKLPNGQEVAVKRLSADSGQGDLEFKNEVLLVAKLQHRNLIRLLGFCLDGTERLLVYEFVPNASLDQFLFGLVELARRNNFKFDRPYMLRGSSEPVGDIMRYIHIALLFVQENVANRPNMGKILLMLSSRSLSLPVPHNNVNPQILHFGDGNSTISESSKLTESKSICSSGNNELITELYPR
ncbi:hypothetical protein MTR67_009607 [Solanum verrucosum]|uniref:Protein kinase domain-containing protein n=1 Tax=Solanum verrucosum TaxID=315347 RepID=A0AAF0TDH7_SOLVR|nr:hypothetical protein MTR67_009607 [Solanum verrucosum]